MSYDEFIHDRGRGPEIKGTRITVYSILDWMIEGWHCERIADFFRLHPEEVQTAMDYVRAHTLEVLREYVKILERAEARNTPELLVEQELRHERYVELAAKIREAKSRGEVDVQSLIDEFRAAGVREAVHAQANGGQ